MKFPKYLCEVDFAGHNESGNDWPTRELWVARTRDPFVLALVKLTDDEFSLNTWPPVLEGNRRTLADKLCHALLREFDLYPGDLPEPALASEILSPPEFIHMLRPTSTAEYVLAPHAPTLWKIHLDRRLNTAGCEWVKGFGREPNFPEDTRRVANFLQALNQ